MALMAYNRSADLEDHIRHIPGNVGSTSVLSPLNQPCSPDEDKESSGMGTSYYGDSPLGSPNRDGSETAGEGTFRPDIGLTDKDLIDIETKDLNKKLKKANVSKDRAKAIKAERRTLKNRGYASSCRIKREKEVERLEEEIRHIKHDVTLYQTEITEISNRNIDLKEWHVKMDECMTNFELPSSPDVGRSPDAGYVTDSEAGGLTPPEHVIKDEELDEEDEAKCIEHNDQCDCNK